MTKAPKLPGRERDLLVEIVTVLKFYELGRTDDDKTFLAPRNSADHAVFLGSRGKRELAATFYAEYGCAAGRTATDEAWATLEGIAGTQPPTTLPMRVAREADDDIEAIHVDLGYSRLALIYPGSWEPWHRQQGVMFRRSKAMREMVDPVRGGDATRLFELLNVAPANRDLFLAWVASSFIPDIPHPIAVLRGEQGAAKSSTARCVSRLIDPCIASTQKPPRSEEEWAHACSARWLVSVDNVSNVPEWWSDALCRTVTGDGWLRRQLYTDDEVTVSAWRRVVLLNGITLGASLRPDLAERLILFNLDRPAQWLTETEVDATLDAIAPSVLGGLFDMLALTLEELAEIEPIRDLRMADFATYLAAFDKANGTDALNSYRRQVAEAFDEALAADPLAGAVLSMMEGRDEWAGTSADLKRMLDAHRPIDDGYWPKTAHHLSTALTRSAPSLRRAGIEWHRPERQGRGRICRMERISECVTGGTGGAYLPSVAFKEREEEIEKRNIGEPSAPSAPTAPTGSEPINAGELF